MRECRRGIAPAFHRSLFDPVFYFPVPVVVFVAGGGVFAAGFAGVGFAGVGLAAVGAGAAAAGTGLVVLSPAVFTAVAAVGEVRTGTWVWAVAFAAGAAVPLLYVGAPA